MQYRNLGCTGIKVSPYALGAIEARMAGQSQYHCHEGIDLNRSGGWGFEFLQAHHQIDCTADCFALLVVA
jgi:hypothetical protein